MSLKQLVRWLLPLVLGTSVAFCAAAPVRPTVQPWDAHLSELWESPRDLADRDFYLGPWGGERAPDPHAVYTFVRPKDHGVNPGVVVRDPLGREWHVKQPPHNHQGAEGPVEVVLSRVLSGVGYHQPPVYYLPSFTMADASGTHVEPGGRFRLHEQSMADRGPWSWQQNPFVETRPYQGLLVILMMFNGSDLKNSNNTLYEVTRGDQVDRWYVVRDLGTALGETGRIGPKRGDVDRFARTKFILDVKSGFVQFDYHGLHQEIVRRITPDDVGWASALMRRVSTRQWRDAFRAGEYPDDVAGRFVAELTARVERGHRLGGDDW